MATHSSVLAWRISGMGKPGGLLSMGSHRVGHDWSDLARAATAAAGKVLCPPHPQAKFILWRPNPLVPSAWLSSSVVYNSLRPRGLQHTRPPFPSPTPGVYPNLRPLSRWCHWTISSSVVPFSCLQSFPASGSFPVSLFFASGGKNIGASASVLPMNIQDWFPLGFQCLRMWYLEVGPLEKEVRLNEVI